MSKARIGNPPFFFTRAGKAEIKRRLAAGERAVDLAAYYGVHRSAISYIKRKYNPNKTKGP